MVIQIIKRYVLRNHDKHPVKRIEIFRTRFDLISVPYVAALPNRQGDKLTMLVQEIAVDQRLITGLLDFRPQRVANTRTQARGRGTAYGQNASI
jgi:hypothetical protein